MNLSAYSVAHLALQSLFLLVAQHGLERPRFYERLHSLLTPTLFQASLFGTLLSSYSSSSNLWHLGIRGTAVSVQHDTLLLMQARHRADFFLLADRCLASGLLPASAAAGFAKRFARLALTAPPAGALVCLAFVHNLIRYAPCQSCNRQLHGSPTTWSRSVDMSRVGKTKHA